MTASSVSLLLAPTSNWSDPAPDRRARRHLGDRLPLRGPAQGWSLALLRRRRSIVALVALALAGPLPALLVWIVPDVIARFVLRPRAAVLTRACRHREQLRPRPAGRRRAAGACRRSRGSGNRSRRCTRSGSRCGRSTSRSPGSLSRPSTRATGPRRWSATSSWTWPPPCSACFIVESWPRSASTRSRPCRALAALDDSCRRPAGCARADLERASAAKLARAGGDARAHRGDRQHPAGFPAPRRELACAADLAPRRPRSDQPRAGSTGARPTSRRGSPSSPCTRARDGRARLAGGPAGERRSPEGSRILASRRRLGRADRERHAAAPPEPKAILSALGAEPGSAFDPAVVEAAAQVRRRRKRASLARPTFQPQLHRLPVPRSVRRRALPLMLPRPWVERLSTPRPLTVRPAPKFALDAAADHVRGSARARGDDRARRDRRAGRARLGGPHRALRRLDRHVLARQRQVRRLRRGLRLLRPVALRRGRHADARDDGARPDPRARQGRRGRRRAPVLHGHPGPGALEAGLREDPRGRQAGRRAHQPEALRLGRPHLRRPRAAARRSRHPARPPQRRDGRAPTTTR